jgi:hypothetical protein
MEITQILLIIVVLALTSIMSIVGIEVFFIFKEIRQSMKKFNKMLDNMGLITESIAKPIAGFSGFITGLRSGTNAIRLLTKESKKKEKKEKTSNKK